MTDEQLERAIDRLDTEIYNLRRGSQFSPSAQSRIAQMSARLNKMIDERDERGIEENPSGGKVLKKFPKGTELRGGYARDKLSIWGDRMAIVEAANASLFSDEDFDPQFIARRYYVYFTDLVANDKWLGAQIHFRDGKKSIYEQPFSFQTGLTYPRNIITGQLDDAEEIWVEVGKMSDLTDREDSVLQRYLDANGYKEAWKKPLTAAKWRKLLAMSLPEIQNIPDADYDLANAVDYMVGDDERAWDAIRGIYTRSKKGTIKWVITRNPKGSGL
jgi:hypothetical protein